MPRAMSLSFTFELTLDDTKVRVTNRPGDVLRLRARNAGTGVSLDDQLAAGGTQAYETLFTFAYEALRHHDGYATLTFEEFCDRVTDWAVVEDEPARPTGAAPSSEP
ncbi:MAG TPA: hypothetical protein VJM49_13595 [Acidimicrobiales bacterium]|nr:hypothetical protein [Acidimicrobiales bacterium]